MNWRTLLQQFMEEDAIIHPDALLDSIGKQLAALVVPDQPEPNKVDSIMDDIEIRVTLPRNRY
jgi:hypothetical protein